MATSPTPVDAAPTVPDRTQRSTFPSRMSAFFTWMATSLYNGMVALAANAYSNALSAEGAANVKNVGTFKGIWSAATTYAAGESVLYGGDYWLSNVNGNLNNAPVQGANWSRVYRPATSWVTATGSLTASPMVAYAFTAGGTLTLPATPNVGDIVGVRKSGDFTVAVARNGKNIEGKARDVPLAGKNRTLWLTYAGDAAGGWIDADNSELLGSVSPFFTDVSQVLSLAGNIGNVAATQVVQLDSDRELVLFGGNALYGVVYNNLTGAFGTPTLIRNASVQRFFQAIKTAADQVLVVSVTSGAAAAEGVVLTISGSTISVATAATATLGSAISESQTPLLQMSGGSILWPYRAATGNELRALTIAGTTTTIGAAVTPTGTSSPGATVFDMGGNIAMALTLTANTTLYAQPYTVAGSTLTLGSGTSTPAGSASDFVACQFASGRLGVLTGNSQLRGLVVSVAGTVASISAVNLSSSAAGSQTIFAMRRFGSQAICASNGTLTVNVLTDNAGVATAGTEIVLLAVGGAFGGNDSELWLAGGAAAGGLVAVGISGNNPVINATQRVNVVTGEAPTLGMTNKLTLAANQVSNANGWAGVASPSAASPAGVLVTNGRELRRVPTPVPGVNVNTNYGRGVDDSQLWTVEALNASAGVRYHISRTRTL